MINKKKKVFDSTLKKKLQERLQKRIFSLSDTISFGSHKGETIEQIIKDDVKYVQWLIEDCFFELSNEAFNVYTRELSDLEAILVNTIVMQDIGQEKFLWD